MCIYTAGLLIPCIVQYTYLALFLNVVVNLWNSDVDPMNFHKVIQVLVSFTVLQIISHEDVVLCILCTVLISFSNIFAL